MSGKGTKYTMNYEETLDYIAKMWSYEEYDLKDHQRNIEILKKITENPALLT